MTAVETPAAVPSRSTVLDKVETLIDELDDSLKAQMTDEDAAPPLEGEGFVSAFQLWYENGGGSVTEISHLAALQPRYLVGDASFDVLLYLFELRAVIKHLWKGSAPSAAKGGPLLPLLFRFFGFPIDFVTSMAQLYKRAQAIRRRDLKNLSVEDSTTFLHGLCFEKPVEARQTYQ